MTLVQLAERLRLSTSTVSRALNNEKDVSPDTKARVISEARKMGYDINRFAQNLRRSKANAIAVIYPERFNHINNIGFIENIAALSRILDKSNMDVFLVSDAQASGEFLFNRLVERNMVDGVIVAHVECDDQRVKSLLERNTPFLALGRTRYGHEHYSWFDFDNEKGVGLAVEDSLRRNKPRIAYLGGDSSLSFIQQRRQSFFHHMKMYGKGPDAELVCDTAMNVRSGYEAVSELFAPDRQPPESIIVDDRYCGEGAVLALEALDLSCYEVPIYVYDGLPPDTLSRYGVYPILQSKSSIVGEQIGNMILEIMEVDHHLQILWQPTLGALSIN